MASRRGSFGRQPRVAPSLTNTLVAIAREMQNQRDQNIMSAWQKGGKFEGQDVTDSVILKHWQHRLEGISKDDPLYDTYKNAVSQYEYSIAESKMTVQYAQGHISDQAAGAFYLNWAKKVPKDSEFWRVLQRDAAQYMRASQAKNQAEANRQKELAYAKDLSALGKGSAVDGFLMGTDPNAPGILLALAQRGDADHHITQLISGPGSNSDFNQFSSDDPEMMLRLLGEITPADGSGTRGVGVGGVHKPTPEVLFTDNNGKAWTGEAIVKAIKAIDPKFDGDLTLNYVKTAIDRSIKAVDKQIALAKKTGHVSDLNQLRSEKTALTTKARQVNAYPVAQDYEHLKKAYEDIMGDPTALSEDKSAAWDKYQTGLRNLAEDPRIAHDDAFRSALVGEADQNPSTVTIDESFTRFQNPDDPNKPGDVTKNIDRVNLAKYDVALLSDPESGAVYTQGEYQKDAATGATVFVPKPGGSKIGVSTRDAVAAIDGKAQVIDVTTAGSVRPMLLMGQPVKFVAKGADGSDVIGQVASSLTYASADIGGHHIEQWSFQVKQPDGSMKQYFSDKFPGDDKRISVKHTGGGVEITLTGVLPTDGSALPGTHWDTVNHNKVATQKLTVDNIDQVLLGSDPVHNASGYDPHTDFPSALLAAANALPPVERTKLVTSDKFQNDLVDESYVKAGMHQDDKGQWIGTPAQQVAASQNLFVTGQVGRLLNAAGTSDFLKSGLDLWDRLTTNGLTGLTTTPSADGRAVGSSWGPGGHQLPLDSLAGTNMSALGDATHNGTNIPKLGQGTAAGGTTITGVGNLRIPQVDLTALPKVGNVGPGPLTGGTNQPYIPGTSASAPKGTPAIPGGGSSAPAAPKPPPGNPHAV